MEDRRVFERFAVTLPVNLVDLDAGGELAADTCDVSAKGIGVVSKEYLRLGNRLELWLKIGDGREPLYTMGSVMWSAQQETGEYRSGILLEKAELMGMSRIFRS
ncbi:MAG: PilZ domain-containing protein [Candidatus Omnitrophota bacterium]|nr:PilZ domain-containing protein [Candidatus Omnitrophota bacterium]